MLLGRLMLHRPSERQGRGDHLVVGTVALLDQSRSVSLPVHRLVGDTGVGRRLRHSRGMRGLRDRGK